MGSKDNPNHNRFSKLFLKVFEPTTRLTLLLKSICVLHRNAFLTESEKDETRGNWIED